MNCLGGRSGTFKEVDGVRCEYYCTLPSLEVIKYAKLRYEQEGRKVFYEEVGEGQYAIYLSEPITKN